MEKKDIVLSVGAGIGILYGITSGILQFIVPIALCVGTVQAMVAFAGVNERDREEAKKQRVMDADEIIPPTRQRRTSSDDTIIDLSAEEERQIWRAEAEVAKLEAKLAQKRSSLKTLKRSAQ